jgi:hypothetical protein
MPDPGEALRRIRHELRGAYHHLLLCMDALAVETVPSERLLWLDHIGRAADRCAAAAAEMEAVAQEEREPAPAGE